MRQSIQHAAVGAALVLAGSNAVADFIPVNAGPHAYTAGGNWDSGNVNGVWSRDLTQDQIVTFSADTVLLTGWAFNYGAARNLTVRSDGIAPRLVTLAGDVSMDSVADARITLVGGTSNNALNLQLGASRVFTVAGADTLQFQNVISGSGFGITKEGAGTLTLQGSNTFSGDLVINNGAVQAAANTTNVLGTGTIQLGKTGVNSNTATLRLGNNNSSSNALNVRAGSTNTLSISNTSTANGSLTGPISLANNLTLNALNAGKVLTLSGAVTGTGNLAVNGAGIVAFGNGSNSFVGDIDVDAGTTFSTTGSGNAFNRPTAGLYNKLSLGTSSKLVLNGSQTIGGLSGSGLVSAAGTANRTLTFDVENGNSFTHSGAIADGLGNGSGNRVVSLTKSDLGTQALTSSASTYTSVTTITGGVLSFNSIGNAGLSMVATSTSGSTTLTVADSSALQVGWAVVGTNISDGSTIESIDSPTSITLSLATSNAPTSGAASFGAANGMGVSTSAASNLVIDGGTLKYTGAATNTDRLFQVGGATTGAVATVDASGSGPISFTNPGALAFGTAGATATPQTRTLVLTGSNTGANTLAALIQNNGSASNGNSAVGVTKQGAGTWVLTSANTYTGATIIDAGLLQVNGSLAAGSAVTVNAGTLAGTGDGVTTGVIAGPVTVGNATGTSDAVLAPGNSVGTLKTGATSFLSDGVLKIELTDPGVATGSIDRLNVVGNLSFAAGSVIQFQVLAGTPNDTSYVFATYTGAFNGTFGVAGVPTGYSVEHDEENKTLALVVPEPASLALLSMGVMGLLRRRRSV